MSFLSKSKKVSKIFCIPGNAGTSLIAQNLQQILIILKYKTIIKNNIDIVVIGPEKPLVNGWLTIKNLILKRLDQIN